MTSARRQFLQRMLITLVVLTALAFPVMIVAVPRVHRWYHIRMITSPDLKLRERGLNYVIKHVDDPDVLEMTVVRLPAAADDNFQQVVNALHHAGVWSPELVGADSYLRWLEILVNQEAAETSILVTQRLTDWPEAFAQPRTIAMLQRLIADSQEDVRYNALCTIAVMLQRAPRNSALTKLLVSATRDSSAAISRHAWIYLGLIDSPSKIPLDDWSTMPPEAAEAMLWAATQMDAKNVAFVLEALQSSGASSKVRAGAVYALNRQSSDNVRHALTSGLARDLKQITAGNVQPVWRTILSLPLHRKPVKEDAATHSRGGDELIDMAFANLLRDLKQRGAAQPASIQSVLPLVCAAAYADPFMQWIHVQDREQIALLHLAKLEGLAQFGSRWPVNLPEIPLPPESESSHDEPATATAPATQPKETGAGPMVKLSHFLIADQVDVKVLRELLASEEPTMRDLACIAAAQRLSKDELNLLILSLLTDFNDDLKGTGAILAGLTGLQREFLQSRLKQQSQWSVTTMIRLGLWMQHDPEHEYFAVNAPGLLARTDLPRSSVLLAMLHRGHPAAFDYLLNPMGELHVDVMELFEHFRWWRVFNKYLPRSAPEFWCWADEDLQRFQIDVLRDWYLLNRHRLKQPPARQASDEPRP